ncbi:MAG: hypothetical protein ACOCWQ_05570 [Nanoarchaeota archaeon]
MVPSFYLFYIHQRDATTQVSSTRVDRIGNEILKQARVIYYMGKHAKTTLEFDLPDALINDSFRVQNSQELLMRVRAPLGNHTVVYYTNGIDLVVGNCTDAYPFSEKFYRPGKKRVVLTSCGNHVSIREAD